MPPEFLQPKFETLVIASSSAKRRDYLSRKIQDVLTRAKEIVTGKHENANLARALQHLAKRERIGIAALSPDADAGVEESTSTDTEQVSIEKIDPLLVALGLLPEDDVKKNTHRLRGKIIRRLALSNEVSISPEEIAIFASDSGTFVEIEQDEDILGTEESREMLKINRQYCYPDGTRKASSEVIGVIIREYHDAVEKYTKGNFWVLNRIGFAFWHQGRMLSEEWEIKLKYRPLPKKIVQDAFLKPKEGNPFRGTAAKSAPRVELVELMKDYATKMWIRRTSASQKKSGIRQDENPWLQVDVNQLAAQELLSLFVLGGAMPTMAMIEFMVGNHISPEQMLEYMQQEKNN